ncbi:MAG: hypothetical protein Q4B95_02965 [Lonepinella koalarum]|nr:hypothetical protein [Lonepinella koalarum]
MKRLFLIPFLYFLYLTTTNAAMPKPQDCSAQEDEIVRQFLGIDEKGFADRVLDSACKMNPHKIFPNQSDEILVAYGILDKGWTTANYQSNDNDTPYWTYFVGRIVNNQLTQTWQTESAIDAAIDVSPNSFWIDTARYQLKENEIAFGVRFHSSARGASSPDRGSDNDLTLFVNEGNMLKPIFNYPMQVFEVIEGAIGSFDGVVVDNAVLTVHIDKKATQGYQDLLLKAHLTRLGNGRFGDKESQSKDQVRLKFDGKRYRPVTEKWWAWSGGSGL